MRRRATLILVLLAGGGTLSHAQPSTSWADNSQTAHTPTQLWKTFPLRQQTTPRRESQPRSQPRGHHDRSRNWLWLLIATTVALSATATAVVSFLTHTRQRGGHIDRFRPAQESRKANDESQQGQEPLAEREQDTGAEPVIGYLSPAEASSPDSGSETSVVTEDEAVFDRLGEHVSSVLSAAKAAAVRIQEEARQEAEHVRDLAHKDATERLEAAREDADATRAEAERLRSEAEDWSKQTRAAEENSAADRRAQAEAEASDILSAAEREAASFSENAQRRQQALKMDISLAEDRLRQLAAGLHELAGRLDTLLSTPPHRQQGVLATADDDSLIDALGPTRETKDATM
jgi:hypothetical protein